MYAGEESVVEVAHMVAYLPSGGALGQYYGGWLAVSDEVAMLMNINYTIAVTSTDKPKRVPKPKPPEGIREMERKASYAESMAAKFRNKHRN